MRLGRYGQAVADASGPVRGDVLPFELQLDEPIYQLVRQQLLAYALENDKAEGAARVRVLHVSPGGNDAYQSSLHRPEHLALGQSVSEVWQKLLRHQDRFLTVDSKIFLDAEITSREYVLRYAPDVIYNGDDLRATFALEDDYDLEDLLYAQHDYDGDVRVRDDGVELYMDGVGTGFEYPFTMTELRDLADEMAAEQGGNDDED